MNLLSGTRHGFAVLLLLATFPVLAATSTVTNTNDSGPGSLRQALLDAMEGDRVEFAIGTGPQTILPAGGLPVVNRAIVIDGTTQPGYSGTPLIEIDGSSLPEGSHGLYLDQADVSGLSITNVKGVALHVRGGSVRKCFLGMAPDGTGKGNNIGLEALAGAGRSLMIGGEGSDGNRIAGNYSGIYASGATSIQGNQFVEDLHHGPNVYVVVWDDTFSQVRIGGLAPNLFVGGGAGAVVINNSNNVRVTGNTIGLAPGGENASMPIGIQVSSSNGTVIENNIITGCTTAGVIISNPGLRNEILGNSIYGNTLGIDLYETYSGAGPTPNDHGDGDTGPNNYINYPLLADSVTHDGQTIVTGTLDTLPNVTQRVELFASPTCGSGGQTFLGAFDVTTNGSGEASFALAVPTQPSGTVITATATSDAEGTSEFSGCVVNKSPGTFSFKGATRANDEGDATVVTINRVDGGDGEVTVTYAVTGGTASAADFTGATGSLTFATGETFKSFTVQSTPDSMYEADETILISLTGASAGAQIGSPATTTVTIDDDDLPPSVRLRSIAVPEGDSGTTIAEVPISLSQATGVAYSLFYTIDAGEGATIVGGSVTFQPGEIEKHIPVTIVGDQTFESNQVVQVKIHGATPTASATVTILNDDPPPTVSVRTTRAIEGNGPSTLMIALASDVPVDGEVTVSVREGSAHLHTDFEATSQSLLFSNEASKSFVVTILGDDEPEDDKQFEIELHTSSPGITAGPNATITIVNDDLRVSPDEVWIPTGGTGTFTVQVGTSLENVTVGLTADTPGSSVPATLVIPAGQSSAEFTVSALTAGTGNGITIAMPLDRGGATRIVHALTYAPATLRFSPSRLSLVEGETVEVSVSLDPPALTATTIGLNPTGRVDVPSSLTIPAGGTATFAVIAKKSGFFAIEAQLPPFNGNEVQSLFGDVIVPPSAIQISTVTPTAGSTAGGTHTRVNGSHFNGSCWLFFGSTAATNVVVRGSESITGVAPAHGAGDADVTVRCTGGTFTADRSFTYRDENDPAPLITEVDPAAAAPGELVTIRGLNFRSTDRVAFDSSSAPIADASPESHVVTVPDLPAGNVSVFIEDALNRMTTSGPLFSVLEARPPRITEVSPSRVAAGGELELTGEGFRAGTTFEIGGHIATILSMESTRAIVRVSSETARGSYPVQVRIRTATLAEDGPSVEIVDGTMFVIAADPRCTTTSGGVYAIIRGRSFPAGATVAFAGVPSEDVTREDERTLRVKVPPGDAGAAQISVTDGTGHTATLTNGFTYASPFDPRGCGGRARTVRH